MNFQEYSTYYELLYKDKNYAAEAEYIVKKLRSNRSQILNVLELGCGSGAHAQYISQYGIQVTGVERSSLMLEEAQKKQIHGFVPHLGDIENFELETRFDAAISLFHVISYLTKNEQIINCFMNTRKHLKPNGIFIFDVWYAPAVLTQRPSVKIKRMSDNNLEVTRIAEPTHSFDENIVNVNFEVYLRNKTTNSIEVLNELHPMRYFSTNELSLIASQTGFEIIESVEFMTDAQPSDMTWGVCYTMKKKS